MKAQAKHFDYKIFDDYDSFHNFYENLLYFEFFKHIICRLNLENNIEYVKVK